MVVLVSITVVLVMLIVIVILKRLVVLASGIVEVEVEELTTVDL